MDLLKLDLQRPKSWRASASNLEDWVKWDRAWRKRLGWRAGLGFWQKSNVSTDRIIAYRHWPHRLCWQWTVRVGLYRKGYDTRRIGLTFSRRYRTASLHLWLIHFDAAWQDSDHMVAVGPPYNEDAPKIYWKHHLENVEPMGSA